MTAKDLRLRKGMIEMCQSDNFRVLLAYFMEDCPHVGTALTDATSLIRNEGKIQGWMGLLREMRAIHISPPEPEIQSGPRRLYQEPSPPENPNRPTK